MSQEKGKEPRRKVNRRHFAITSVAAGAATVAFPNVVGAEAAAAAMPAPGSSPAPAAPRAPEPPAEGWREGTTIPAEYYVDPRHFARDERYIADHIWLLVDHQSRIPNVGDYFLFEYGRGDSVIILRDNARQIRAYHNVCRHRGSRLCRDVDDARPQDRRLSVRQLGASGNTPLFRCPYHAWTYDIDGRLISAYGMPKDFDPAKNGLVPCHLRIAEGHIFVSLTQAATPPEFESEDIDWLRKVSRKYRFADLKVGARRSYPIKANWKLALENFRECYHCGPSHRNLVTTHNWDYTLSPEQQAQKLKDVSAWVCKETRERAATAKQGSGGGGYTDVADLTGELNPGFITGSLDGKPVAPLLPGIKEWTHCTDIAATGWSSGYWQAYDDHVAVARFTPRDVALTDCEIFWLVHPEAVEGKDYDVERLIALWHITIQEDIWIVENNHVGIMSGAYRSGRYAEHETAPAGFINWYMANVVRA